MSKFAVICAICLALPSMPASAESLAEALREAYRTNPTLLAARASEGTSSEAIAQAKAAWRPTVTFAATGGYEQLPADTVQLSGGSIESNYAQADIRLNQPLYTGGRLHTALRAAEARTSATHEQTRLAEVQVFLDVVGAFMDVVRDQTILDIRSADVDTLSRQLAETQARYQAGANVTMTDVAQARAQQQSATVSFAAASADLDASRAEYAKVVGHQPHRLEAPDQLGNLPASLDEAAMLAQQQGPGVLQAEQLTQAARADAQAARAAVNPTISLQGQAGYIGPLAPFHTHGYDREVTGLIVISQPIFAGGLLKSQIRQADDKAEAAAETADATSRQAIQTITAAWSRVVAGRTALKAGQDQVDAALKALKGMQLEYGYGLRSTIDVLLADQALRAAQLDLARSRHDAIVAASSVLALSGRSGTISGNSP